jgi:hypothetical protein
MRCNLEINNHRNVFHLDSLKLSWTPCLSSSPILKRSREISLEVHLREFGASSHRQAPDLSGDDWVLAFFDRDRSAAQRGWAYGQATIWVPFHDQTSRRDLEALISVVIAGRDLQPLRLGPVPNLQAEAAITHNDTRSVLAVRKRPSLVGSAGTLSEINAWCRAHSYVSLYTERLIKDGLQHEVDAVDQRAAISWRSPGARRGLRSHNCDG